MTDVQQHVNIVRVLEVAIEPDNVLVAESAMDLNLASEFLSSFTAGEACFRDNFERPCFVDVFLAFDR